MASDSRCFRKRPAGEASWLRWIDNKGEFLLTGQESAGTAKQRADTAEQRAARLEARLRELGIDPNGNG